ncbi:uncharacterized protein KY384_001804 [Bacidia gigantensis]|uniref:uncharacterized protein n=1 Tax=Bacidia gigantensis TaxID=2732470 RepID=UPI001D03D785|nr:uncharacterized protein KY384_001804 [Bacidia gigantensis]KAG8533021.1 hypothetical protein KY384_001804 [Bacidia gigantensis]
MPSMKQISSVAQDLQESLADFLLQGIQGKGSKLAPTKKTTPLSPGRLTPLTNVRPTRYQASDVLTPSSPNKASGLVESGNYVKRAAAKISSLSKSWEVPSAYTFRNRQIVGGDSTRESRECNSAQGPNGREDKSTKQRENEHIKEDLEEGELEDYDRQAPQDLTQSDDSDGQATPGANTASSSASDVERTVNLAAERRDHEDSAILDFLEVKERKSDVSGNRVLGGLLDGLTRTQVIKKNAWGLQTKINRHTTSSPWGSPNERDILRNEWIRIPRDARKDGKVAWWLREICVTNRNGVVGHHVFAEQLSHELAVRFAKKCFTPLEITHFKDVFRSLADTQDGMLYWKEETLCRFLVLPDGAGGALGTGQVVYQMATYLGAFPFASQAPCILTIEAVLKVVVIMTERYGKVLKRGKTDRNKLLFRSLAVFDRRMSMEKLPSPTGLEKMLNETGADEKASEATHALGFEIDRARNDEDEEEDDDELALAALDSLDAIEVFKHDQRSDTKIHHAQIPVDNFRRLLMLLLVIAPLDAQESLSKHAQRLTDDRVEGLKSVADCILWSFTPERNPGIFYHNFNTIIPTSLPYLFDGLNPLFEHFMFSKNLDLSKHRRRSSAAAVVSSPQVMSPTSPISPISPKSPMSPTLNMPPEPLIPSEGEIINLNILSQLSFFLKGNTVFRRLRPLYLGGNAGFSMRSIEQKVFNWPSPSILLVSGTRLPSNPQGTRERTYAESLPPKRYPDSSKGNSTSNEVIYGAYLDMPWKHTHKGVAGGSKCLLFQLAPIHEVFRPSSLSHDYFTFNKSGLAFGSPAPRSHSFSGLASKTTSLGAVSLTLDESLEFGVFNHDSAGGGSFHPSESRRDDWQDRFEIESLEIWGCGGDEEAERQRKAWEFEERRRLPEIILGEARTWRAIVPCWRWLACHQRPSSNSVISDTDSHQKPGLPSTHRLIVTTTLVVFSWDMSGVTELFSSSSGGSIHASQVLTGDNGTLAALLHTGRQEKERKYVLKGCEGQIRLLHYSGWKPQDLYFTTSVRKSVQVVCMRDSKVLPLQITHPSPPVVFTLSSDSNLLLSSSLRPPTIYIRNIVTGAPRVLLRPNCSSSAVVAATFHPERGNIFLLAFADGTIAVYDASRILRRNGDAREQVTGSAGAAGEVASLKRIHTPITKDRSDESVADRGHDPKSENATVTADQWGLTSVSLLPGHKAMAVTAGGDGKCCVVDFSQPNKSQAVLLKSWHIHRPVTCVSVIYAREDRPIAQYDGTDDTMTPSHKDYRIAVGRQDGKVLLFDLEGKALGQRAFGLRRGRIVNIEWAERKVDNALKSHEEPVKEKLSEYHVEELKHKTKSTPRKSTEESSLSDFFKLLQPAQPPLGQVDISNQNEELLSNDLPSNVTREGRVQPSVPPRPKPKEGGRLYTRKAQKALEAAGHKIRLSPESPQRRRSSASSCSHRRGSTFPRSKPILIKARRNRKSSSTPPPPENPSSYAAALSVKSTNPSERDPQPLDTLPHDTVVPSQATISTYGTAPSQASPPQSLQSTSPASSTDTVDDWSAGVSSVNASPSNESTDTWPQYPSQQQQLPNRTAAVMKLPEFVTVPGPPGTSYFISYPMRELSYGNLVKPQSGKGRGKGGKDDRIDSVIDDEPRTRDFTSLPQQQQERQQQQDPDTTTSSDNLLRSESATAHILAAGRYDAAIASSPDKRRPHGHARKGKEKGREKGGQGSGTGDRVGTSSGVDLHEVVEKVVEKVVERGFEELREEIRGLFVEQWGLLEDRLGEKEKGKGKEM